MSARVGGREQWWRVSRTVCRLIIASAGTCGFSEGTAELITTLPNQQIHVFLKHVCVYISWETWCRKRYKANFVLEMPLGPEERGAARPSWSPFGPFWRKGRRVLEEGKPENVQTYAQTGLTCEDNAVLTACRCATLSLLCINVTATCFHLIISPSVLYFM